MEEKGYIYGIDPIDISSTDMVTNTNEMYKYQYDKLTGLMGITKDFFEYKVEEVPTPTEAEIALDELLNLFKASRINVESSDSKDTKIILDHLIEDLPLLIESVQKKYGRGLDHEDFLPIKNLFFKISIYDYDFWATDECKLIDQKIDKLYNEILFLPF